MASGTSGITNAMMSCLDGVYVELLRVDAEGDVDIVWTEMGIRKSTHVLQIETEREGKGGKER
jgi:hypothetical protein